MRTRELGQIRLGILVICLFVVSMAICSPMAPTASAAGTVAVKEWEIPMLSVLTGPLAFAGVPAGWGADYAAKMLNQAGGIAGVPVKITIYDTGYDNAKATALMAQVVPNALVVLGPINSGGALAVASVVQESRIPTISGAFIPETRKSQRPWGMACMQDAADAVVAINKWLTLNKDIKSVVIFYQPTNPSSVYEANSAGNEMLRMGIKIAGKIEVAVGQIDMRPQAAKALALGADGYYGVLSTDEYIKMVKALKNRGLKDGRRILGQFSANSPALFEAGKGHLEDTYLWENINLDYAGAAWKALRKAYQAEHNGSDPLTPTVGFYDAVYAVKAAIESQGITGDPAKRTVERQKIRDFLYNNSRLQGAMGTYKYINGNKVASFFLMQVKDNKFVNVAEVPGPATPAP